MKIKAALFDLDGVIVDTAKYHFLAWRRLAQKLGFEFTEKDNERLKGVSRMRSLEILLEVGGMTGRFSQDAMEAMAAEKNGWYVEYISKMDESEILPGTVQCLLGFRSMGIRTALGSASKNAMMILQNLNLLQYFDAIIDGTKVSKAKPDPEVFLLGAKELSVEPSACVVFEDAQAGIEAAKAGGMKAVAIGRPGDLKGYDMIFKGLFEIDPTELVVKLNR